MVKVKVRNITEFLTAWDREIYDLNILLKKMHKKQKKDRSILRKKEDHMFRVHK